VVVDNKLPVNFGVDIHESGINTRFDQKLLLASIPRFYKQKATSLLQTIEERPSEINFDTNGTIFINGESIPSSDIYKVFPALYKKSHGKSLAGFKEIVYKLKEMNLDHLFKNHQEKITIKPPTTQSSMSAKNWYFLN